MRKLSLWSKEHVIYARILIIVSRCLLFLIACFLGNQFSLYGYSVPAWCIYIFIAVFFVAGATYPAKKGASNYRIRKLYDLAVAVCGFFIVLTTVMQLNGATHFYQASHAAMPVNPSPYRSTQAKKLLEQFQRGEKTKFTGKEKRIIRREFNHQLLQYAKAKVTGKKADAGQAAAIVLACAAAVGLFYLVASLACTLSCNGSDVAAVIVMVVGTAAIVWGLIAVIRAISRKRKTGPVKTEEAKTGPAI